MQIDLNQVQREREKLAEQLAKMRTQIQELDEIKVQLNRRESTREFADVLTRCKEELSIQSEGLKRLGMALEEILYDYKQERLQLPRFSVNSVALDGYGPEDAGIHIYF